uniref:Class III homeodomain-leucine zipper protein n=1 Tax=Spirogyra pratensis TaxID=332123 RepID=A0A173GNX3_9VIRI|nr:class III homeodomain-leucine zipper protein [Spirogyra pratensis]
MEESSMDKSQDSPPNGGHENGKYVRYTPEQVEALERVYNECPKPSSVRRQMLIKECKILSNIEPKQIKVWFQNRRCRERQRLESARLQTMNAKLTSINKTLVEENEIANKKIAHLTLENAILRQQMSKYETQHLGNSQDPTRSNDMRMGAMISQFDNSLTNHMRKFENLPLNNLPLITNNNDATLAMLNDDISRRIMENDVGRIMEDDIGRRSNTHPLTNVNHSVDNSQESVVTHNFHLPITSKPETNSSGLLNIAEEILAEFLTKTTGTSLDFVDLPIQKNVSDYISRISVLNNSNNCVAARVAAFIPLEPFKIAEYLKEKSEWMRECRRCDVLGGFKTPNGGAVELVYTQMYALTTLSPPRDLCTLRYGCMLEDGGYVMCERSLTSMHGGTTMPAVPNFVRADMLPSGYLIKPIEGKGSFIVAIDHLDLQSSGVPEVLKPMYESSSLLAKSMTIAAIKYLKRMADENNSNFLTNKQMNSQQLTVWRSMAERMARNFNEAVNSFADKGWNNLPSDGLDDVSLSTLSISSVKDDSSLAGNNCPVDGGFLCAKASMLLQNVPPSLIMKYLKNNRSEWSDMNLDNEFATTIKSTIKNNHMLNMNGNNNSNHIPLPFSHIFDQDEVLELVKLENNLLDSSMLPQNNFLIQLSSISDQPSSPSSSFLSSPSPPLYAANLIFSPVDTNWNSESVPLLCSGFQIVSLNKSTNDSNAPTRTLDLASMLENQTLPETSQASREASSQRSVLTIAFQFVYTHVARDSVALIARQYVRNMVSSIQRAAMAISPPKPVLQTMNPIPPPKSVNSMMPIPPSSSIGSVDALLMARRILQNYRTYVGSDLILVDHLQPQELLQAFWNFKDAIICIAWKQAAVELVFANKAGLDMLEVGSGGLSEIPWEKTMDEVGKKAILGAFTTVMSQGYAQLSYGLRISKTGRPVCYDSAIVWKVMDADDNLQCIAISHSGWSFIS